MNLIVGKKYDLKYTEMFCHWLNGNGFVDEFEDGSFIFVGNIDSGSGKRNIFYDKSLGYIMFASDNLEYIVK